MIVSAIVPTFVPMVGAHAKETLPMAEVLTLFSVAALALCSVVWLGLLAFAGIQFLIAQRQLQPDYREAGTSRFSLQAYNPYGRYLFFSAVAKFKMSFVPLVIVISSEWMRRMT